MSFKKLLQVPESQADVFAIEITDATVGLEAGEETCSTDCNLEEVQAKKNLIKVPSYQLKFLFLIFFFAFFFEIINQKFFGI